MPSYPPRQRPVTGILTAVVVVAVMVGAILALRTHHTSTTHPATTTSAAPAPTAGDPLASITPMDAAGTTTFPITHMTITQDGVRLNVSVDDGAAIPTVVIRATVPLNGTPITPTPGTSCATIPGQIPVCVMRWQAHQDQVTAWVEAQPGQCELTGSTTPGVRTQIKCATTHQ